jgi:cytochrome P450
MIAILCVILKWILFLLLPPILYFMYEFLLKQYLIKRYYSSFPNVYVSPRYVPLFGDAIQYRKDIQEGRPKHYHQIEYALSLGDKYDFRLFAAGNLSFLCLNSRRAFEEFGKVVPDKVDRHTLAQRSFGKLCPKTLLFEKSTENWRKRRDCFMKYMGLNSASKFISSMLDASEEIISQWKVDGQKDSTPVYLNMLQEYNKITFKIITVILFGKDVNEKVGQLEYITNDDSTETLSFSDFFIRVCKDLMSTGQNLVGIFLPVVANYNLVKPFSTNIKNVDILHKALKAYLKQSKDEDSVYYKLIEIEGLDEEETFHDLLGFLFAGHETSSHLITS